MSEPRVLIAGGGIGGLCLAHGLRAAGIDVVVAERTVHRTDWLQGYRIHIDPAGSRALHACLSPQAWDRFTAAVSAQPTGMSVYTEQLRRLATFDEQPGTDPHPAGRHHGISRIALREALLTGLDDVVRPGTEVIGYDRVGDRVRARFADGTVHAADLLVGADGANSRIRAQLLPRAGRVDIGVTAIAGKHRLPADLPPELTASTTMVFPPRPGFLFTAVWLADRAGAQAGTDPAADYVFWAYADAAARLPSPAVTDGSRLRSAVLDRLDGWSPDLGRLVAGSDPATVAPVRVRSASRVRRMPGGPVTLLGDAIHSMTPMAGIGANTALRDADLLRRQLTGGGDLREAVAAYEREMLRYGFAAVRASERHARLASADSRLLRTAVRGGFRVAGALAGRA